MVKHTAKAENGSQVSSQGRHRQTFGGWWHFNKPPSLGWEWAKSNYYVVVAELPSWVFFLSKHSWESKWNHTDKPVCVCVPTQFGGISLREAGDHFREFIVNESCVAKWLSFCVTGIREGKCACNIKQWKSRSPQSWEVPHIKQAARSLSQVPRGAPSPADPNRSLLFKLTGKTKLTGMPPILTVWDSNGGK